MPKILQLQIEIDDEEYLSALRQMLIRSAASDLSEINTLQRRASAYSDRSYAPQESELRQAHRRRTTAIDLLAEIDRSTK